MKRFVSYLYSIYNNQKIHNAGFARIELRTGRNRIEIHLKDIGYAGKTGTVYLFVRNKENIQGVSIGSIAFRGNQAELRYEQPDEIIGQTSWTIMEMNGIIITFDKKVSFLSQWDEVPVDIKKFEVWEQTNETKEKAKEQSLKQTDQKSLKDSQHNNGQDRNMLDKNIQDRKKQDNNRQDKNIQSRNVQNRSINIQNRNIQDRNIQDRNIQNGNVQNRSIQDRNIQNRNIQGRNVQNQNEQDQNAQNQNGQNRNVQNQNEQDQNVQNRNEQKQNVQNRNEVGGPSGLRKTR